MLAAGNAGAAPEKSPLKRSAADTVDGAPEKKQRTHASDSNPADGTAGATPGAGDGTGGARDFAGEKQRRTQMETMSPQSKAKYPIPTGCLIRL